MKAFNLQKACSILVLVIAFIVFLFVLNGHGESYSVVKIISPTEILVIDANHSKKTVFVKNIKSFVVKPDENQLMLDKKLNITTAQSIGLGYLATNFAKNKLTNKSVKLDRTVSKKSDKVFSTIYVDRQNYGNLLLENGLAVKNNLKVTRELKKSIYRAEKLNLRIFNNKSHKYHKLTCKYGLLAHNIIVMPQSQIPKGAKPCGWCLKHHKRHKHFYKKHYKKYEKYSEKGFVDFTKIPYVAVPPKQLETSDMRFFLTDMTKVKKPDNRCQTPVCKALVNEIKTAQYSIDFAIYGYTKIPAIQNALANAVARGVAVRFVYDIDKNSENIYPDTFYLAKIFPLNNTDMSVGKRRAKSKYQSSIMHNKFFIFDDKTVFTGSANISNTDMSGFNSNVAVIIDSPQIAKVYEREFRQMYLGKFHKSKKKLVKKNPYIVGNSEVSVFFSPKDRAIETQLIPLVDGAKHYIYMPVFLISHKELLHHLVWARKRGVSVMVILDATNAHGKNPKHVWLRKNGVLVKTENFAGKLHSKTMLIDDTYTVIGSMNFSKSGDVHNDENLLVIKNRQVTLFYKKFFFYLWNRIPAYWLKHNAMAESPYSIGSCSDGIDNDFDGKTDMKDSSCKFNIHKKKRHIQKLKHSKYYKKK